MAPIPLQGLQHITVAVRDARAAAARLSRVYGIPEWSVDRLDAASFERATTHGYATDRAVLVAVGSAPTAAGSTTFELVQPVAGWTTYHEFLHTRGEGIHSIGTATLTPAELDAARDDAAAHGVAIAESSVRSDGAQSLLLDTREKLGGFYIELRVPKSGASAAAGEVWDMRSAVAGTGALMPLIGVMHFGVVVPDLMRAVAGYAELFGTTAFSFRDWSSRDSLEQPTYLGQPVDHAYFTTMVNPVDGLGFELIQPTFGPSHYKEEFLAKLGPGIHHIHSGMVPDAAAWGTLRERMEHAGVPMVMSGGILNGFLDFYYLDTRDALAGYVTEFVVPGPRFAHGRPNVPFSMVADLSRPAVGATSR
jgi:hypothetical protein